MDKNHQLDNIKDEYIVKEDLMDLDLIDEDGAARRGDDVEGIKDIVIHYVGNPGTTAEQN